MKRKNVPAKPRGESKGGIETESHDKASRNTTEDRKQEKQKQKMTQKMSERRTAGVFVYGVIRSSQLLYSSKYKTQSANLARSEGETTPLNGDGSI